MTEDAPSAACDAAVLSQTLKAIRKFRGMTPKETARAMHMASRTYQRFEAGDTRVNLDYIHRFAAATRSDPQAILDAIAIGSPVYALRACDNQMSTILTVGVKNFNDRMGDRIQAYDSRTIAEAVIRMFEDLAGALGGDDPTSDWLEKGLDALNARRPKPGR
jgi:transcriptional regulator with XRE-family HTH domain